MAQEEVAESAMAREEHAEAAELECQHLVAEEASEAAERELQRKAQQDARAAGLERQRLAAGGAW